MLPEAVAREVESRIPGIVTGMGLEPNGDHAEPRGECVGSRYHTPRPLTTYLVTLLDGSKVRLCGTCRDNLRLLRRLLDASEEYPPTLPWDAHRVFGNTIRELGRRGV